MRFQRLCIVLIFMLVLMQISGKVKQWVFVHISHGGGTYFCSMAAANGMRVRGQSCMILGDGPRKEIVRTCSQRAVEAAHERKEEQLFAVERGFNDGEYCPDLFRYILFMRNPLDVIGSILSTNHYYHSNAQSMPGLPSKPQQGISFLIQLLNATMNIRPLPSRRAAVPQPGLFNEELLPEKGAPFYDGFGWGMLRLDNFFIRCVLANSSAYRAPLGAIGAAELQRAKQMLDHYELVFTFDDMTHFPEQVNSLLKATLGWQQSFVNASAGHNSHSSTHLLTAEQINYFAKVNKYDLDLYEYAKKRFLALSGRSVRN